MEQTFLERIIQKKTPCIFVSPHFDDAYLSCGTMIATLSGKTNINIINIFTQAHSENITLSAKKALKDAGYPDGVSLYNARLREDQSVFAHYNVDVINLCYQDALFRKKEKKSLLGKVIAEFDHIYPTYRFHMHGRINTYDTVIQKIFGDIQKYIVQDTLLFIPSGIGGHVDHLIARKVCEENYSKIVYYSDFPYNVRQKNNEISFEGKKKFVLTPVMEEKEKMLQLYKTQFSGLFGGGRMPKHQEIYYY